VPAGRMSRISLKCSQRSVILSRARANGRRTGCVPMAGRTKGGNDLRLRCALESLLNA
jgi:hypothetical protein